MTFFNKEDLIKEYESHTDEKKEVMNDLQSIIVNSKATLEGNAFYYSDTLDLYSSLYTKQVNLFWCGKQATTRICEIGFNAGHSTMLLLLGRKTPLEFTIFDIGMHAYTKPSLEYIISKYPSVQFEYIEGDSILTMPQWIEENSSRIGTYDVVHVDGGHSEECILNDMKNADRLVKVNGFLIIDDTQMVHINYYVDMYIESGRYKEVDVLQTEGYWHRIIQKISL